MFIQTMFVQSFYSSSLPQSAVKLEVIKGVLSDGYTGHYFLFKTFIVFVS